jgi:hypothetical protein
VTSKDFIKKLILVYNFLIFWRQGPAFVYNGSLYYNATKRKGGTLQQRGLRERLYKVFLDEEQRQFFAAICGESGEIKEGLFFSHTLSNSIVS